MKTRVVVVLVAFAGLLFLVESHMSSQPSFNGTTPGCGPTGGCHTFQSGILSVTQMANLQVRITCTGGTGNVAGELVDTTGTVVAFNNGTSTNPFVLTATHAGRFTVNAGYKNPSRRWDSTVVVFTVTDVDEQEFGTPHDFHLEQNYPNPFNPSTTIEYYIPASGQVSLKVVDVAGNEVALLVNGWQHSGRHTVKWAGGNHSSGVYFYRLDAGRYTETRKLVLIK